MKRKTGTREWSEHSANLFLGCEHDCRYCYAREMAIRFSAARWAKASEQEKRTGMVYRVTRENWPRPLLNVNAAARRMGKVQGVVMCPTAHDITPANVAAMEPFLRHILEVGNQVLIVTKPHRAVVERLCASLLPWRGQIEWRMTITTLDTETAAWWEPAAPVPEERLFALGAAMDAQYRASVSIEPMLSPRDVVTFVEFLVRMFPPETIWIGKMNEIRRRVRVEGEEDRRQVARIEVGQTDERILEIVRALAGVPQIRWKDSVQIVIDRENAKERWRHGKGQGQ